MIDKQLRDALKARGESDYAVGKATKLGQSVIYRFRTGKGISLANAAVLAKYLGCTLKVPAKR